MTFEQKQIPHVWVELHLPPRTNEKGEACFAISPKHLHIWPRQEFMLIGLPNKVRSRAISIFRRTPSLTAFASACASRTSPSR